jgi:hypothetical protein
MGIGEIRVEFEGPLKLSFRSREIKHSPKRAGQGSVSVG